MDDKQMKRKHHHKDIKSDLLHQLESSVSFDTMNMWGSDELRSMRQVIYLLIHKIIKEKIILLNLHVKKVQSYIENKLFNVG